MTDDQRERKPLSPAHLSPQGWRAIARTALSAPELRDLPCKNDLLLVAYDIGFIVDANTGVAEYGSKPRKGGALEGPDARLPSLCEIGEISGDRVSKCLKLLVALRLLGVKSKAGNGKLARYKIQVPDGGVADYDACLEMAVAEGFNLGSRRRDTAKATEHRQARKIAADSGVRHDGPQPGGAGVRGDVPQKHGPGVRHHVPQEETSQGLGYVTTVPSGVRHDGPPGVRHDGPPGVRRDVPPLPIGVEEQLQDYSSRSLKSPPPRAHPGANEDQVDDVEPPIPDRPELVLHEGQGIPSRRRPPQAETLPPPVFSPTADEVHERADAIRTAAGLKRTRRKDTA